MVTCAEVLLPIFIDEKKHQERDNVVFRERDIEVRITCAELAETLAKATQLLAQNPARIPRRNTRDATSSTGLCLTREAVYFSHPALELGDFKRAWSQGTPIVITDVQIEDIGPDYFIRKFPQMKVDLEDCETGARPSKRPTVREFLLDFGRSLDPTKTWKLKDWPPKALFSSSFGDVFHAFMNGVPIPDMCRFDGVLNLAAHMPTKGPKPDLGPKAYIAQGTKYDDNHSSSTLLHMDLTSAVNVMVWAADIEPEVSGYALWHIFPADLSNILRKFLISHAGYKGLGDPIHSQTVRRLLAKIEKHYL
ncbi:hypothetical protein HWV62_10557 [Athelia sp. TMB]|nr:hypothetical protein HWV62_10557 [Athelia sp. TMB]